MMNSKRFRKKIGDVFEVSTSKGLAYFQYTHEHTKPPKWGSLIRVLEGFYDKRLSQEELIDLVKKPHRFQTFCFLQFYREFSCSRICSKVSYFQRDQ